MRIRTRFTLLFALLVGVILSFFSAAFFYLSEDYRQTDFHARLDVLKTCSEKDFKKLKWRSRMSSIFKTAPGS